ncbi:MAG: CocE/NonD family hydrolase [Streptosporangiales bacterium]|nr:CocE/NonD family hydrolase [Streptosporangiales bacterium]
MDTRDLFFPSGGSKCAATLYLPDAPPPAAAGKPPVIVMAHGLGCVRAMGLASYAGRFSAAGYACLVFDYRHFGDSEGEPRQLLSVARQREDWQAAIACARDLPETDGGRVIAWGASFAGGHVIAVAAERPDGLAAVIAQCPVANGPVSALTAAHPLSAGRAFAAAVRDLARARRGKPPHLIAVAGPPGTAAILTAPDAEPGYRSLVPPDTGWRNEVAARAVFDVLRQRPGRRAARITVPVLVALCETDPLTPAGPARRAAARAPRGETRVYAIPHFGIYAGDGFDRAVADQLDFLRRHVPVTGGPERD